MKLVASFLAISSLSTAALSGAVSSSSFMEDNDLWKEDASLRFMGTGLTEGQFNDVINAAREIYEPVAKANRESLKINARWDDSTVNANCSRMFGSVTINMYGGLARRPEVNAEGFALVLCHELGHAYGGAPYIQAWRKMSAEGQSDYYGTKSCLANVLAKLNQNPMDLKTSPFGERACADLHGAQTPGFDMCLRQLSGGQALGDLLATLKKVPSPAYDTPDPTVVKSTLTSYPETIQCRLDTYFRGALGQERPACWFKK